MAWIIAAWLTKNKDWSSKSFREKSRQETRGSTYKRHMKLAQLIGKKKKLE